MIFFVDLDKADYCFLIHRPSNCSPFSSIKSILNPDVAKYQLCGSGSTFYPGLDPDPHFHDANPGPLYIKPNQNAIFLVSGRPIKHALSTVL